MDYAEARPLIQDGDLIAVRDVHGIIGRATVSFTHKPYTHTGVAVWLGDRLFMADLNSGRNHLTAVSQLSNFDVCDPPLGLDRSIIRRATFDWLAERIDYGFLAFPIIGLKCALKLKVFIHWRKIIVCSGGSVQIFEMAAALMHSIFPSRPLPSGWLEHTRMLSPGELVDELPPKFEVRALPSPNPLIA